MRRFNSLGAPQYFGAHPEIKKILKSKRLPDESWMQKQIRIRPQVQLSEFYDSRHPEVYVIPRNKVIEVVDGTHGSSIGFEQHNLWFSSTNFYIDFDKPGAFEEMQLSSNAFFRLGGISQLGYLIPPFPKKHPKFSMSFAAPAFPHSRWIHCLLAAVLAEVILARNGFDKKIRDNIVRLVGFHDIAMPAGGDSIKHIAPDDLDEENNFLLALDLWGLRKKWEQKYNFDAEEANAIIHNEGVFGFLLDVVDKMSYVCLDSYYLGLQIDGPVRKLACENPLFMDVWQDIQFTEDKTTFAFKNPDRLYFFLLMRAYEHQELLLNPYARVLDFFLTNLVKPFYEKGEVTKKQLLMWTTDELQHEISRLHPEKKIDPWIYSPEYYTWHRFNTQSNLDAYCAQLHNHVYFTEHLKGFNPGLGWPVFANKSRTKIVPLHDVLPKHRIDRLQKIVSTCSGYFAYSYIKSSS